MRLLAVFSLHGHAQVVLRQLEVRIDDECAFAGRDRVIPLLQRIMRGADVVIGERGVGLDLQRLLCSLETLMVVTGLVVGEALIDSGCPQVSRDGSCGRLLGSDL
jgi:hypothetical protein